MSHQNNLSTPLNIVAVSGGLNSPSKTESLVQAILDELAEATQINVHFIKLSEIGPLLGGAIYRNQLPQRVQDDLAAVEAADALIVGTPVYRASFTGLFKHFFDFVEQTALVDVPVLLAASGGSDRHAFWKRLSCRTPRTPAQSANPYWIPAGPALPPNNRTLRK